MKKLIMGIIVWMLFVTCAEATTAQERVKFCELAENMSLSQGIDEKIRASGKDKSTLTMTFVLYNRASVYQTVNDGQSWDLWRSLGFKKIVFSDGFGKTWTYKMDFPTPSTTHITKTTAQPQAKNPAPASKVITKSTTANPISTPKKHNNTFLKWIGILVTLLITYYGIAKLWKSGSKTEPNISNSPEEKQVNYENRYKYEKELYMKTGKVSDYNNENRDKYDFEKPDYVDIPLLIQQQQNSSIYEVQNKSVKDDIVMTASNINTPIKQSTSCLINCIDSVDQQVGDIYDKNKTVLSSLHGKCNVIKVIGIGGAGRNFITSMTKDPIQGVTYIATDSDFKSLALSSATSSGPTKIQLGANATMGLGAGSNPEKGREAAQESIKEFVRAITEADLVILVAGMGGGTGTGAAQVFADAARTLGVFLVAVVTLPFLYEGQARIKIAEKGVSELSERVDSLIVIPNENICAAKDTHKSIFDAFAEIDAIVIDAVRKITELLLKKVQESALLDTTKVICPLCFTKILEKDDLCSYCSFPVNKMNDKETVLYWKMKSKQADEESEKAKKRKEISEQNEEKLKQAKEKVKQADEALKKSMDYLAIDDLTHSDAGISHSSNSVNNDYSQNSTPVICPKCKARDTYHASGKGFGLGKAAVGGILMGPAGLLGGLIGSKKLVVQCISCGHKWCP
ncbi:FtsZ/tubulin family protein [Pelobacter propionicus]|uniref:hypothetical protein n=1 Tax=Pelobacter propionicus TaxID=29543 RepID=UPI000057AC74|nr:hypothetical protein [Pelobacter propionicus]